MWRIFPLYKGFALLARNRIGPETPNIRLYKSQALPIHSEFSEGAFASEGSRAGKVVFGPSEGDTFAEFRDNPLPLYLSIRIRFHEIFVACLEITLLPDLLSSVEAKSRRLVHYTKIGLSTRQSGEY